MTEIRLCFEVATESAPACCVRDLDLGGTGPSGAVGGGTGGSFVHWVRGFRGHDDVSYSEVMSVAVNQRH